MVFKYLSVSFRNVWPKWEPRYVFKPSSSGLACLQPQQPGRTLKLFAGASLVLQFGGKLVLIGEGMSATLNHQQDQVKKTRTWSRYLGLGVAQGSVGPVHEPTVQNGCEGLQQLQEVVE
jgi:hypothetical protein